MATKAEVKTGECPMCKGTGRMIVDPAKQPLAPGQYYGYRDFNPADQSYTCNNCVGYGYTIAPGRVPLRPDGTPCTHEFTRTNLGRCYNRYTCKHKCGTTFTVDSSD